MDEFARGSKGANGGLFGILVSRDKLSKVEREARHALAQKPVSRPLLSPAIVRGLVMMAIERLVHANNDT